MRATFNLSVIATFLLIGFSVFYYFVIFLPGKERVKEEEMQTRKIQLSDCLQRVEQNYKENWDKNCKTKNLEPSCTLPSYIANSVEDNRKQLKDECFKRYQ